MAEFIVDGGLIDKDIINFGEGVTKLVLTTSINGDNKKYYIADVKTGKIVSDITWTYFNFIMEEVLVTVNPTFDRVWNGVTGPIVRKVTEVFSRVEAGSYRTYNKR